MACLFKRFTSCGSGGSGADGTRDREELSGGWVGHDYDYDYDYEHEHDYEYDYEHEHEHG